MPDNRKPLKYGAFPVCRNYTVRAQLRQLALCQWRQHEGNSGMARPQRYLYHHEYLHPSGCGFQDCFGQCNPEYFPCRVKMSLQINPEMEGHSDKTAAKAKNSRKNSGRKIKKEPANMRKSHICEFKSWCRWRGSNPHAIFRQWILSYLRD